MKIEFITVEKGRGVDSSIRIKNLGINAIPLRFVSFLLDKPIMITDSGTKVLVPNPTNFCLHKLIIASRRRNRDKRLKDLQQAICTSVILDKNDLKKLFNSLPKKWKGTILQMLEKSEEVLPLFSKEIEALIFTLQKGGSDIL